MMRKLVAGVLLGALVFFLEKEQRAGRFLQVDEGFQDFLIANVRARFEKPPPSPAGEPPAVVWVELRPEEAGEYAGWPPLPLDWKMILDAVKRWEPEVLVVADVLNWGEPKPEFVPSVAEVLAGFPTVVLAAEGLVEANAGAPVETPFLGGLEGKLPRFAPERWVSVEGAVPPTLKALVSAPEEALRVGAELGVLVPGQEPGRLGYAMRMRGAAGEEEWVPSLLAQALSRVTRSPYALQRLRLGPGAGAHLADGVFVPLTPAGDLVVPAESGVKVINAVDLLAGDLAGLLSESDRAAAESAPVVVVGQRRSGGGGAGELAAALAAVLAQPRVRQVPEWGQWIVWALALGLVLRWVGRRGRGAVGRSLVWVFAGLVVSYLVFEAELLWCPPTVPAAILLAGGLLAALLGQPGRKEAPAPAAEPEASAETPAG